MWNGHAKPSKRKRHCPLILIIYLPGHWALVFGKFHSKAARQSSAEYTPYTYTWSRLFAIAVPLPCLSRQAIQILRTACVPTRSRVSNCLFWFPYTDGSALSLLSGHCHRRIIPVLMLTAIFLGTCVRLICACREVTSSACSTYGVVWLVRWAPITSE